MSDYEVDDDGGFQLDQDDGSDYHQAVPRDLVCTVCGSRQFKVTDDT